MLIAQQLGRYHLLDRIAHGGMAEIFRGMTFDPRGRQHFVAIKRLFHYLAEDEQFLQMLIDEARIASLLDHPNIARVYEFARSGEEHFLAMEFVEGRDLRSLIDACRATGRTLAPEHCACIMAAVLDGLHAAHEQTDRSGVPLHIVHRDLSPSNVIVSYAGEVKLCDFGIAKATLSQVQTRAGIIKGKIRYMSPEQTRGLKLDRRSDLFSAGSVLYELLTGKPAFQCSGGDMSLVLLVREAKYPNLIKSRPDAPKPLQQIVQRALSRSRGARYQTAQDFADDLRAYLARYHHGCGPDQLGELMRDVFASQIEAETRKLSEYVLTEGDLSAIGQNLLGEASTIYTQFTPLLRGGNHPGTAVVTTILPLAADDQPQGRQLHEAQTHMIGLASPAERQPADESRVPLPVQLHEAPTFLFDLNDDEDDE